LLQAQLCALAEVQCDGLGDDTGLETVPDLEELAALFAGTGLGKSMIIAEHLLGTLVLPVSIDKSGEHKVCCHFPAACCAAEDDGTSSSQATWSSMANRRARYML
jgi:hypothetical protein